LHSACQKIDFIVQFPETQDEKECLQLIDDLDKFKDFKEFLKYELREQGFHYEVNREHPTFLELFKNTLIYLKEEKFTGYYPEPEFVDVLKVQAPPLIETLQGIVGQLLAFNVLFKKWIAYIQESESFYSTEYSLKLIWHFTKNEYHLNDQNHLLGYTWKFNKDKADDADEPFRNNLKKFAKKLGLPDGCYDEEEYEEELKDVK